MKTLIPAKLFIIPAGCLLAAAFLLLAAVPAAAAQAPAATAPKYVLKAAARTFAITPRADAPASGYTDLVLSEVVGDLKSTLVLFEYGPTRLCFLTSSLSIQGGSINPGGLSIASRLIVAKELGLTTSQVVLASSHNHTVPQVVIKNPEAWGGAGKPAESDSNEFSREFLEALGQTARGLEKELVPVTVEWGVAKETRVTYNRRGRRPDGRSYFIREEDRMELGESYIGEIDPDATVVLLRGEKGLPVAALAFFTGHPVTGYNPEKMASHGQWSQVACDKLSAHLGGVPVGFLQGCAGDINSKYMLTGTIQQAIELGEYLGESYIAAVGALNRSVRTDLQWSREKVEVPHAPLPAQTSLQRDLMSIDAFIKRGQAGDENTLECVGMNFPRAMTPPYRARLVDMVRPWYVWALDQHRTGKADEVPKFLPLDIVVARIGDVGFVGLPYEPFVRTGFKIKRETPLPCVLPCGYVGDSSGRSYGYIPDASAVNDREYQAGFFRYIPGRPPYRAPAGDRNAEVAVAKLTEYAK